MPAKKKTTAVESPFKARPKTEFPKTLCNCLSNDVLIGGNIIKGGATFEVSEELYNDPVHGVIIRHGVEKSTIFKWL